MEYELNKKELDEVTALLELSKVSIIAGLKQRPNLFVRKKLQALEKALINISNKFEINDKLEIFEDDIKKHL